MAKRKSKSDTRPRRIVVKDPALPLLNGIELVAPPPYKPLPPARQRAWERDKAAWLAAERARSRARAQEHAARLARRPAAMQRRYRLPPDVAAFLTRLRLEWESRHGLTGQPGLPPISAAAASDLIEAAYMEGCRQGFIEGRVLDLEPKRQRSAKANAAKRQKPREHNGMRYTLDQRDAAIVAEYAVLRPMVGAGEAQYRLAEKYDLTDKMIRIIVGKARRGAGSETL